MTYVNDLLPRIRRILEKSDLATVSAKKVRKQLAEAGEDEEQLKAHKLEIDERIGEIYEELCGNDDEDDVKKAESSDDEQAPSQTPLARTDRKPKMEDQERADRETAERLQAQFDASVREGRSRRAAAPTPKKKAKKRKAKSASDLDSDGESKPKKKRGGGGAFNKELVLSDALAAFIGEPRLARPQVVKRLWEHIKANDLQDPSNRQFILCDDRLKTLFNTDRLHMFQMPKLLEPHLRKPEEVVGAVPVKELKDEDSD